jgi:two-component system, NtrC family, response regulator AtoC
MSNYNIAIVEDDPIYGKILRHKLSMDSDYNVMLFENARQMLAEISNFHPDLVTLDLNLPDMNGVDLLKAIKEVKPDTQVIILSGQEKIDTAIELFKLGIFDYIMKDPHAFDKLWFSVHKATKHIELSEEITLLRKEVSKKYDFKEQIIGASSAIQNVFSLIEKTCNNNINLIITGETGTGKELVAKAVHFNSSRKSKPFVAVNVAAIPKDLVESEMFGYEKGAFTGANQSKPGKLEEAKGGTLFLDEIGEMDLAMQAKLLRVLQEMEVTRLGSNRLVPLDFRLIVATHRNLLNEVNKGNFREDLYYRLMGVNIDLPPLRNRKSDIIVIANYFIKKFAKANKMLPKDLSLEAKTYLSKHPFPGNVRELKAIVETGFIMSEGHQIEMGDLKINNNISVKTDDLISKGLSLEEYTNQIIKLYLIKNDHNVINTAKELKIGKSTIYRLIQEGKLTVG